MRYVLDHLLGYTPIQMSPSDVLTVVNRALQNGVTVSVSHEGKGEIPFRNRQEWQHLLQGVDVVYGKKRGLWFLFSEAHRHIGVWIALGLLLFLGVFSSMFVWDIRVEGEDLSKAEILRDLEKAGLTVGNAWRTLDTDAVRDRVLSFSETVGWLNIYKQGMVAYVTAVKKYNSTEPSVSTGYANMVSEEECVVTEVLVKRGQAVVSPGEAVRPGDVLISGIPHGGTLASWTDADGEVIGQMTEDISVCIAGQKMIIGDVRQTLLSLRAKFFCFSINIFQKSYQCSEECDIIDEKTDLYLFGYRLPIGVYATYRQEKTVEPVELSSDQMVRAASLALEEAICTRVGTGNVLQIQTKGGFSGEEYVMTAHVVFEKNIAKRRYIETDKTS